jgi:hypothetical protein
MVGRVSSILRHQIEAAERNAGDQAMTALREARDKLRLALGIVAERLRPLEAALWHHDIGWLESSYAECVAEIAGLRDEVFELRRLLSHIELVLDATGTAS